MSQLVSLPAGRSSGADALPATGIQEGLDKSSTLSTRPISSNFRFHKLRPLVSTEVFHTLYFRKWRPQRSRSAKLSTFSGSVGRVYRQASLYLPKLLSPRFIVQHGVDWLYPAVVVERRSFPPWVRLLLCEREMEDCCWHIGALYGFLFMKHEQGIGELEGRSIHKIVVCEVVSPRGGDIDLGLHLPVV